MGTENALAQLADTEAGFARSRAVVVGVVVLVAASVAAWFLADRAIFQSNTKEGVGQLPSSSTVTVPRTVVPAGPDLLGAAPIAGDLSAPMGTSTIDPTGAAARGTIAPVQSDPNGRQSTVSARGVPPPAVLRNADIVMMTKQGLADDIIVSRIERSKTDFDPSPDTLIALRKQGVSEKVLAAMLPKGVPRMSAGSRPGEQTLDSSVGSVRIKGISGGEVFLNGSHRGSIDSTGETLLRGISAGAHQVRIVSPNRPEFRMSISVVAGQEVVVDATSGSTTSEAARVSPPSSSAQAGRVFPLSAVRGTRSLHVLPNQVRYERKDSQGRLASESFTVSCDEISDWKAGRFDLSLQLVMKNGQRHNFDVRDLRMKEILDAFAAACGPR
jgi:hypothetical protein